MTRTRNHSPVTHEHTPTGEKLVLLGVFAHPQDEAFGPAGTLAKYASEGIEVSLVTATRDGMPVEMENSPMPAQLRDRACACRASGIRRACLFDYRRGELPKVDFEIVEERLVRMIREIRPQVIITFRPGGLTGDEDNEIISAATSAAFRDAGDPAKFAHQLDDGLSAYAPQKLYHCLLPNRVVQRWGVQGLKTAQDDEITTVLDVSAFSEAMKNAMYCQRHGALDFMRWLADNPTLEWKAEYYALVESRLPKKSKREKDLFAGLR